MSIAAPGSVSGGRFVVCVPVSGYRHSVSKGAEEPDSKSEQFEWTESTAADRSAERAEKGKPGVMIPSRRGRSMVETVFMRLVATAGIVGIGVAIAAIMYSQKSQGWLIGFVVSVVSVVLAAFLWSSRRL